MPRYFMCALSPPTPTLQNIKQKNKGEINSLPNVDFSTIMSFTLDSVRKKIYKERQTHEMLQELRPKMLNRHKVMPSYFFHLPLGQGPLLFPLATICTLRHSPMYPQ